jgi:hypothetical protein
MKRWLIVNLTGTGREELLCTRVNDAIQVKQLEVSRLGGGRVP